MVKAFSDFGKAAKKLLSDDYVTGKKVEVKTLTENGVSFTATGLESAPDGSLSGNLSWKYKVYGNSFTSKVLTSNAISTEAVFEKLGVNGLKATLNGSFGSGKATGTTKVDYTMDPVAVSTVVDVPNKIVLPSLAVGYKDFAFGCDATFVNESKSVTKYSVGATLVKKDSEITVTGSDKLQSLKVAFSHTVSPSFALAAEAAYNREKKSMAMVTGVKYTVGGTAMKMKADNLGTVSMAYVAQIDPATSLTLSAATNVKEIEKGHKFGLALTLDQPFGSKA